MSKFLFVFRGGASAASPPLSPSEMQAHFTKWYAWVDELKKKNKHLGGQALQDRGASVIGSTRSVTDGPYAEAKDLVTGSFLVEAASLEEAIELAKDCPGLELEGSVEVRPLHDSSV